MSSPKPPSSSRFTGPAVFLGLLVTFGAVRVAHLHTPPDESTLSFPPAEPDAEPRFAAFSVGADQKDEERHSGEEGKMGKPTSKKKSGLYAIEGPKDLIPRSAYGGAYAVGNDDEDVWGGLTGTEIGEAVGVGGLGLVGKGRGGGGTGLGYGRGTGVLQHQSGHFLAAPGSAEAMGRDGYREFVEQTLKQVADDPLSTFSVDVDTASYSNVRRFIREGQLPPASAVRVEEMINAFDYDYRPASDPPVTVHVDSGDCPWNPGRRLVRVGLKARELKVLPPRNLVFLVDTSGSMQGNDRLELVRQGLAALAGDLRPEDRVSIVTYAGSAGVVLPPTSGRNRAAVREALGRLGAGGSTAGAAGIRTAYDLAERSFRKNAINRVILATDGDFNVGVTDNGELTRLIEEKRETGVYLTVLGVGRGNLQDHRMETLADKGNGNYAYLDSPEEARRVLVEDAAATLVTVAKDVKIQVEFNPREVASYRLVGYDNRRLQDRDFNDDRKDAGDMGSGHTVTALYEVVPAGGPRKGEVDGLRYQKERDLSGQANSGELALVKVRFKKHDGDTSRKIEVPIFDDGRKLGEASADFRFQVAVAAYGLLVKRSKNVKGITLEDVESLARAALGDRKDRRQFANLVARTRKLMERS